MENSNPNPSSEDVQGILFFTLVEFCNAPKFNTGEIREISHYKETNLPEHEFLLAKVVGPSPQNTKWLRIDRNRQEIATSLLNRSSSNFPAKDSVHVAANFTPLLYTPSSRLSSLQYDAPNEPSLADFRCLLRLVNTMSPEYKLWQEQCYWFCNSIMDIMKGQFSTELVRETAYDRRGKFKKVVRLPSNAKAMTHIQRAFKSNLESNSISSPRTVGPAHFSDVPQGPPPPSLDPPPYKNGELIIAYKCGDLGQDRYVGIPSNLTLSDAINLSLRAFKGFIPRGHFATIVVEMSDDGNDLGRVPDDNADYQGLCGRGCHMWRLLT